MSRPASTKRSTSSMKLMPPEPAGGAAGPWQEPQLASKTLLNKSTGK
jgi:hypothetical protein